MLTDICAVSGSNPVPAEAKLTPVIISSMLRLGSKYGGKYSFMPIYETANMHQSRASHKTNSHLFAAYDVVVTCQKKTIPNISFISMNNHQPTNEIGGKLPVSKSAGRSLASEIHPVRRKIAPEEGLHIVVVPRIHRRISKDKSSRDLVVEGPWQYQRFSTSNQKQ
ncbi:hypothetical protein V6N12_070893 [Hibiscus sabdariffa]|uniref:Uncharacterized protein n=1 Tax=Hibiscus sabdariffa TaxID=183260 RepID=A0ABR2FI74_9ROSI